MNDALYDCFEELTPSGLEDVPADKLIDLLRKAPEATEETPSALQILSDFRTAERLELPTIDGLYLWIGYCIGGLHEWPRRENCFLFALKRSGDSLLGYATGVEPEKGTKVPKTLSAQAVERITNEQTQDLIRMLQSLPAEQKHSEIFSRLSFTDGPSFAFGPGLSARFFVRQDGERLLFVQPSRLGGWYGALWPKAV